MRNCAGFIQGPNAKCMGTGHLGAEADTGALLCAVGRAPACVSGSSTSDWVTLFKLLNFARAKFSHQRDEELEPLRFLTELLFHDKRGEVT